MPSARVSPPSSLPGSASAPHQRLRVLQLIPALKTGGVEQSAIDMALWLKHQGHRPYVAAQRTPQGLPHALQLVNAGVPLVPLNLASKNPLLQVWNAFRLTLWVHRYRPHLLHARSRVPGWVAWVAHRLTGVPFVATFHGTYSLNGGPLKRYYNSVMTRGPVTIANSHFIAAHIHKRYGVPLSRIVVAPRGLDPADWPPPGFTPARQQALWAQLNLPENQPLILCVGRLTSWKGQDVLLRALARLPADLPWHLALVGGPDASGRFAAHLKQLVMDLKLAGRITFLGNRPDVSQLLSLAQLAVVPSTRPEAFGRSVIEAMASGVPVIAANHGGPAEVLTHGATGWLYPPQPAAQAPQALAQILADVLAKPQVLAKVGLAAQAYARQTYTVDACCAAEFAAYQRILAASLPTNRPTRA